jgi:hypothetical protein
MDTQRLMIVVAIELVGFLFLGTALLKVALSIREVSRQHTYLIDIARSLRHIARAATPKTAVRVEPPPARTPESEEEWKATIERARAWLDEAATGRPGPTENLL